MFNINNNYEQTRSYLVWSHSRHTRRVECSTFNAQHTLAKAAAALDSSRCKVTLNAVWLVIQLKLLNLFVLKIIAPETFSKYSSLAMFVHRVFLSALGLTLIQISDVYPAASCLPYKNCKQLIFKLNGTTNMS